MKIKDGPFRPFEIPSNLVLILKKASNLRVLKPSIVWIPKNWQTLVQIWTESLQAI